MRIGMTLALCCLTTAAHAECPAPEAAATGLALTYIDGVVEIHRRDDSGDVTIEGLDGEVMTHRLELIQGVYLRRYAELEDGEEVAQTQITYIYPEGEAGPQPPVVGATWSGDVVIETVGGAETEPQVHDVGLPVELAVSDCVTTAVPITITYGAEAAYIEVVYFLPDYGIGYLQGYQNAGRDMNQLTVTSIEALP